MRGLLYSDRGVLVVRSLDLVEEHRFDVAGHLGPENAGAWEMDFHLIARLHCKDCSFCSFLDVGRERTIDDLNDCDDIIASLQGCHDSPYGVDSSPWSTEYTIRQTDLSHYMAQISLPYVIQKKYLPTLNL